MSTFDRLCWFAERFPDLLSPSLDALLFQTSLFRFPHTAHEVLPKFYTKEELDFQRAYFHLPFRIVAIEDQTSCVILWEEQRDQIGLISKRWFIELASLSAERASSWNDGALETKARAKLPAATRARLEHAHNFSFGMFEVADVENTGASEQSWRFMLKGSVASYHMLDDNGPMPEGVELLAAYPDIMTTTALRNAMSAVEELMMFNRPDRFIVRETPARARALDAPKIPRAHERPTYTLLHPQEARSKLGIPMPTGRGGRFIGERRRHVRRYPDDPERWPKAHGKIIVVPATWVGPHEANVGRRHYTIMLDL
ncbi:MAG: hypothetical protein FJX72_07815 [Armatimonadetes bacterium]|nr:hypothetical protein [Armatimonadota bacterium]